MLYHCVHEKKLPHNNYTLYVPDITTDMATPI